MLGVLERGQEGPPVHGVTQPIMAAAGTDYELTIDEKDEATERRIAEIELVKSAYSPVEVHVLEELSRNGERHSFTVNRRLNLPLSPGTATGSADDVVKVELSVRLPQTYPVREGAVLVIRGSILSSPSNPTYIRKAALDAIPRLVGACQRTASEVADSQGGGEAVWSVLCAAEEWVDSEWNEILEECASCNGSSALADTTKLPNAHFATTDTNYIDTTLGRRIVYSHHIIANSKRRDLASLASQYKLGGYAKIGWPGVILVEGSESNCQLFVDEIKRWRWQQIQVRGEEREAIPHGESLDSRRRLPPRFEEIGENGMSLLVSHCREAGVERLFLTCMKINDHRTADVDEHKGHDVNEGGGNAESKHGVLVHVDHMNDGKRYRKWLRKTCQAQGCTLMIRQFHWETADTNNNNQRRPTICVGVFGESGGVKKVMKLWRTSRVDVDSKGRPCLERMMTVIEDGDIPQIPNNMSSFSDENGVDCTFEDLERIVSAIDASWGKNLSGHFRRDSF